MAIFTRRTIQRLLNENNSHYKMSVSSQKKRLNNKKKDESFNEEFLGAEWEIVVLNTLAETLNTVGKITHEKQFLKHGRKIDILFEALEDNSRNFIADICTVSDYGIDNKFPRKQFADKLKSKIDEKDLNYRLFDFQIEGNERLLRRGSGPFVLYLPRIDQFDEKIFNSNFENFLLNVISQPQSYTKYEVFRIDYEPNRDELKSKWHLGYRLFCIFCSKFHKGRFFRFLIIKSSKFASLVRRYRKYTSIRIQYNPRPPRYLMSIVNGHKRITSLEENTIYRRLIDKYSQLIESGTSYAKGIILCDGGYHDFHSITSGSSGWSSFNYDANEVIKHFLKKREFSDISFILALSIFDGFGGLRVKSRLFRGKSYDKLHSKISSVLSELEKKFPKPEATVSNAVNHLKSIDKHVGRTIGGGYVAENKIKISSRTVLEALSGENPIGDIQPFVGNPFEKKLKEGKLITSIEVEKPDREADDDYLIFTFGEPDVATSKFTS